MLLTALSGQQAANAHQYTALIDAKKHSEVETAVAAKLAAEPNSADALLARKARVGVLAYAEPSLVNM